MNRAKHKAIQKEPTRAWRTEASSWGRYLLVLCLTIGLAFGPAFAQQGQAGANNSASASGHSTAASASSKIAPDLKGKDPDRFVDVIIQFAENPTEKHFAKVRGLGGKEKARLPVIKGGVFTLPVRAVQALAEDADIFYISPNR